MALEALTAQLPEIKRLWLRGLSAVDIAKELGDIKLTSSIKRAIQQMKNGELAVKISLTEISSRSDPGRTAKAHEADRAYSKLKRGYSQELLDKTDEFTKNPKYKNLAQVENALYKHFNKSKYTLAPAGVPNRELTAFFRPADKIFNIPENFKIYPPEGVSRKGPEAVRIWEDRQAEGRSTSNRRIGALMDTNEVASMVREEKSNVDMSDSNWHEQ